MSIQAGKESNFGSVFRDHLAAGNQSDWLQKMRRQAYSEFTEVGIPTTKNEEWKYTDVRKIAENDWELANNAESVDVSESVVFRDGVLMSCPASKEGVTISSFADASENPVFEQFLGKILDRNFNGFTLLNEAFIEQGLFVHVAKDTKIEEAITITFEATAELASFPRILFVGESGSEAEIVELYTRTDEVANLTNSVTEVALDPNARLKHTRVQRESHSAFHVGTTIARLSRDSVYDNTNINLGGKLSRHDTILEFEGENGEAWVDGLYILEDGQHSDTHSRIDHKVKNCVSHQNYKGILDGKSRAVFNGKVFVHKNASGTDADQSNKNLLLSNSARVDTKPQLEIFNDDVKCAHGATVGQLEEEELFYLLSRGLSEDLARNLLTYGFAEEIISKIGQAEIKKDLDEAVLNRLHARL